MENDVEVVDHKVEHDVDIETAWGKNTHAVDLEEERQACDLLHRLDDGVEAFEMADLENAAVLAGGRDQRVGGFEIEGDGLFDEQIDARFEKVESHGRMVRGGNGNDGGIHLTLELAVIAKSFAVMLLGNGLGSIHVLIDDSDEIRGGQAAEDSRVLLAEGPYADNRYAYFAGCFFVVHAG